jgi:hypothetical protein
LGLLFSSPLSLLLCLKSSAPLQSFFLSASQGDQAWAILSMSRSETVRFGMVEHNGEVRSVAQQVVSFDQHRLIEPSATPEDLLQSARRRGLAVLGGRDRPSHQVAATNAAGFADRAGENPAEAGCIRTCRQGGD